VEPEEREDGEITIIHAYEGALLLQKGKREKKKGFVTIHLRKKKNVGSCVISAAIFPDGKRSNFVRVKGGGGMLLHWGSLLLIREG